jgi:predicted O-methyltransferase YrrM
VYSRGVVLGTVVTGATVMRVAAAGHAELERHLRGVPGWLSAEEAEVLHDLARGCTGRGVIVEIGSFKGRSTICLGLGSLAGRGLPVYAIDPGHGWKRFAEFQANIARAGVDGLVRPIAATSADAFPDFPDPAIELLFIDGSHRYDLVDLDFHLWTRKLVDGGMLAMHDTNAFFPGSCRVAEEQMYKGSRYRHVRFVYSSMTVGQKVGRVTVGERAANRGSLLVKRSFDLALRVRDRVPEPIKRTGRRGLRAVQHRPE